MVSYVFYSLVFLLTPALVLRLCRRVGFLGKVGPVLILYILGVLVGNAFFIPAVPGGVKPPYPLLDALSSAMVPLAIPLMLYGCAFRKSDTRDQLLALITGMVAVVLAVVAGYMVFGRRLAQGAQIGGMLTGVYTGGTINLAALKTMLGVSEETFVLLNTCDMLVSFVYLTFLLSVGIKLFRRFLPVRTFDPQENYEEIGASREDNPYAGLFTRAGLRDAAVLLGVTLLIAGISGGVALLVPKGAFMVVFILMLTTLGIAASFWPALRERKYGYEMGMYLIYVFCMVVAAMADLSAIDWLGSLNLLGYLAMVVFGSLLLQVLMAWLFKIDSDTMVISSVTFVNSPPFVPMICGAMRNRRVLVTGLSIGIVGYAAGNYLGFILSQLLGLLG